MVNRFYTPLLAILTSWVALSGCALLSAKDDNGYDGENDPVARVAQQLREESLGAPISEEDAERIERAKLSGDLTTGMHAGDVLGSWGSPVQVEPVAGAQPGTERWLYREGLSRFGGSQSTRVIYFENHRVVGWETGR